MKRAGALLVDCRELAVDRLEVAAAEHEAAPPQKRLQHHDRSGEQPDSDQYLLLSIGSRAS
jgi:hypothetical protein